MLLKETYGINEEKCCFDFLYHDRLYFEYDDYYEVRFTDLRYRSKGYYPFVAVVQLDRNLNIVSSYTGWIFSEGKLRKKLELAPNS
ncbi:hypothetical protein LG52_2725 [Geobacillus kaustophilus]|uniref:Uncharacterized protein n=1 Tax=Geobacillus kaustophilus TaxID=1462 RepID=A0A0D8BWC5_GEOKU|nr:hypothetical protein LG52_2725 [Geobacillus kaustophilus]